MHIAVCLYTDDCNECTGTVMDDITVLRQLVCCLGPQFFGVFFVVFVLFCFVRT